MLAADSVITQERNLHPFKVQKLYRLKDGSIVALFGSHWGHCLHLLEFLQGGKKVKCPKGNAILIDPKGRMFAYASFRRVPLKYTPYIAFGTGQTLALGAMAAGASAVEAVKAAIKHDPYTKGPVVFMRIGRKK